MDNPEGTTQEHIDQFSREAVRQADSRVPAEGYRSMNVNDYIATLTNYREAMEALGHDGSGLDRAINLYSYLRDKFGAQKVSDLGTILETGQVDPKIIDLWIEEGMIGGDLEIAAVKAGYPDKAEAVNVAFKKRIKEIKDKYRD